LTFTASFVFPRQIFSSLRRIRKRAIPRDAAAFRFTARYGRCAEVMGGTEGGHRSTRILSGLRFTCPTIQWNTDVSKVRCPKETTARARSVSGTKASPGPTTNRKNKKGKIKFEFYGSKLRGEFVLVRTVNTEIGY